MNKSKELFYNIYIILGLILFQILERIIINKIDLSDFNKINIATFQITSTLIYFVNYRFATKLLSKKKHLQYVFAFLGMILLFAIVRFTLEEIIVYNITGNHNYNISSFKKIGYFSLVKVYLYDSFIFTLKVCLYSSIAYLLFRYYENKDKIHQLELENQQAHLTTLKSQISPHFLFNTLNNFYVELIDDKPQMANDILKLSNLMRYVTYETSSDFVSLKNEINFIENYLHFYKRRYEDNLHIDFSVNGIIANQQIPTLILIHFIENVCKHGIINNKNHQAKIRITILKDYLEVTTENLINPSEKYMDTGIGTENIIKRLRLIFGDKYILENTKDNNTFKSYLNIPI